MNERVTIVGQGLAGTCLAWRLWDRGCEIRVVDRGGGRGSSRGAAGLVTPVGGRGISRAWRVERYLPRVAPFFRAVETVLSERVFQEVPILRLFKGPLERERFEARREELAPWVSEVLDDVGPHLKAAAGGVVFKGGGWLDVSRFLAASRGYFRETGIYREREAVLSEEEGTVVACLGAAGLGTGVFHFLAGQPSKGETLVVRIQGLGQERIVRRGGWLIPLGGNLYRAGTTYDREELTDAITMEGRQAVENLVQSFTDLRYEVVEHTAGVRPALACGRPVIGPHPDRGNLYVFNGLGSRGVLYAPGLAEELAAHLVEGEEIEPEVGIGQAAA